MKTSPERKNINDSIITIFIPSFRGGGAERAMILFANELVNRNYQVHLLVLTDAGPLKNIVAKEIRILVLDSKRAFSSLPKVVKYLNKYNPLALYSTIIHINLISILAKIFSHSQTKIVVRESNTPKAAFSHSRSGRTSLRLLPILYPKAHRVIAVSKGVKEALIEMSPKLAKTTVIVATPVVSNELFKLAEIEQDISLITGFDINKPYIIGAGRLHFQKDFETLIKAFSLLQRENSELSLLILGEGEERASLEKLVLELGLSKTVHLPGFVENPFNFFAKAATFVLSSRFEGMPNVLIQALALGVPAVATNCKSGPSEISEDGKHCKLVPISDPVAMAEAIKTTLSTGRNHGAAKSMAHKFGINKAVDKYLAVI